LAATRSQITRRDDDRELQTEQRIAGLPARKLQPDRMDARSWFGMTFAKGTPAWRATPARSAFGAKQSNLIAFANDWVAPRGPSARASLTCRKAASGQLRHCENDLKARADEQLAHRVSSGQRINEECDQSLRQSLLEAMEEAG
jgi:hypothetical protein